MRVPASVLAYFAIAFGISWNGVMLAVEYRSRAVWFVAMLFGPSLAALGLTAAFDGVRGLRELAQGLLRWRVDARLYLSALVAPVVLCIVLSVATLVSPEFAPRILTGGRVGATLLAAIVVGALAGILEELGWTGFATPRLLAVRSWFATGLIIGLPWALWHMLPDYLGRTMSGSLWLMHAAQWFVALTALRVLMTWVYARSRSVLLAAVIHAAFTGSQTLLWPASRSPTVELIWYGTFAIALAVVATIVILVTDRFTSVAATKGEAVRPLPGDWVVGNPVLEVTHAITIQSPPEKVWPWLAQMGSRRGGWYSWDKIDNNGWPSAEFLHSELQRVDPGDVLPALPGAPNTFVVSAVAPPKDLLLAVPGEGAPILTWEHYLERTSDGGSRLIVRGRMAREYKSFYRALDRLPDVIALALARIGHRIMEARHLRGIKRRAEAC
jgi:membrane protease YdiL (CAAX protease family)